VAGRAHASHHGGAPDTSSGFQIVAQFSNTDFTATAAIADNDIWAVGISNPDTNNEAPLAVHFNGTSWSAVSTPTLSGSAAFSGVSAAASNDAWAVGSQVVNGTDEPLIEHRNGTSWSVVSSPTLTNGGFLQAVTAISSNDVWAVGALVEHYNGTSWSVVSSSAFTGIGIINGISADASNDVWAVTNSPTVLHFNGTSWSQVSSPIYRQGFSSFEGVTVISPSDVWDAGSGKVNNRCCPAGLIDHWNGTTFSLVSSPDPKPNATLSLSAIAGVSANDIWAAGFAIENWNGTSWTIVSSPAAGQFRGVAALSDGTVVAVSSEGDIVEN
jgi:hypothetical protein